MNIIINPGSGPVSGATRENADANIAAFAIDLMVFGHAKTVRMLDGINSSQVTERDGRWIYSILADGETHEIEMPGLPIEQVRWMNLPEQNIWDFPRLYVDDSSWVWFFALSSTMNEPDEDSEATS